MISQQIAGGGVGVRVVVVDLLLFLVVVAGVVATIGRIKKVVYSNKRINYTIII